MGSRSEASFARDRARRTVFDALFWTARRGFRLEFSAKHTESRDSAADPRRRRYRGTECTLQAEHSLRAQRDSIPHIRSAIDRDAGRNPTRESRRTRADVARPIRRAEASASMLVWISAESPRLPRYQFEERVQRITPSSLLKNLKSSAFVLAFLPHTSVRSGSVPSAVGWWRRFPYSEPTQARRLTVWECGSGYRRSG
jgi:hypothetical protein